MNLKRCNNGHFYDADKFTTCPYCNPTVSASELTVAMDQAQLYEETGASSEFDDEDGKTVSLQDAVSAAVNAPAPSPADVQPDLDDNKTVSYYAQSMGRLARRGLEVRHRLRTPALGLYRLRGAA